MPIHAIDDDLLDGTQTISVQASAFGYASANEAIKVRVPNKYCSAFPMLPLPSQLELGQ